MEKFSDVIYNRPDIAALSQSIRDYTAALKTAGSAEEAFQLLSDHKAVMDDYTTMRGLASIRNAIDTRDSFYAAEKAFLTRRAPS